MPRTVLIVEDYEHSAAPLEIALSCISGVEVVMLSSPQQALNIFSKGADEIAALVTDIHLPYMDGFELIERVRQDRRYSSLPIVVVSGDTRPDTPERLMRLGADAYFPKPYSPAEIRKKLETLLDAH